MARQPSEKVFSTPEPAAPEVGEDEEQAQDSDGNNLPRQKVRHPRRDARVQKISMLEGHPNVRRNRTVALPNRGKRGLTLLRERRLRLLSSAQKRRPRSRHKAR